MKKNLFTISALFVLTINVFCQQEDINITEFFKPCFYPKGDSFGFYLDADSLKNTKNEDFGENMWAFLDYLFSNYCMAHNGENYEYFTGLLPDTIAIKRAFSEKLNNDTAFIKLYKEVYNKNLVPDIRIEDIQKIAARFYYVHLINGKLSLHNCVGINEVLKMKQTEASPFYNAFCFMVIRNRYDYEKEWLPVKNELAPYIDSDKNVSEEEAEKIRNQVYQNLTNSESYKQDIIKEYERRKKYLNFKIIY